MMVVMTMWLPRHACSQAGTAAQAAPNSAAAAMASGASAQAGRYLSKARITRPQPSPPR